MRFVPRLTLFALVACAHIPPPHPPAPPPSWVKHPPATSKAKIYAVGVSGPTFDPEDSIRYAKDDARAQLAATISTHIQQLMVDYQDESGTQFHDKAIVAQADEQYTDTVVQNAQVLETWVDVEGELSDGRRGTAYALGFLDWNAAPPPPPKVAPKPPPADVQSVEQDSAKAFEAMDAAHEKQKASLPPQ